MQSTRLDPKHESGIMPIDPPTPYTRYAGQDSPRGRVLVIHGLDVSKNTTHLISAAIADGGFEVYAIDLPGHGDSPVKFRTDLAQQAIRNARVFLGQETIVLGHSMGAGLLLDLAATESFSTMVLLAPPPVSISEMRAERVLIAGGELDIPLIRGFIPIASDIGEPHVESWILPWGAHSAPIFNPVYIHRIVDWLGGDGARTRTAARMFWMVAMLIASVTLGAALFPAHKLDPVRASVSKTLVHYVAACSVALVALIFVNPLGWVRLFATDYLIGFVFVAGLALLAGTRGKSPGPWSSLKAIGAAAFVIAVPGLIIGSGVLHMMLSGGRWWRFPVIALAALPLFFSDEVLIRRIHPTWKSILTGVLTRGLFVPFLLTGVLIFNRESGLLIMIGPGIAVFWIALWLATGDVHRPTRSAFAAALFAAIVQGWFFAAWFVKV